MDFTPYITVVVTLLGLLVGTLISPKIQHRVGMEHTRKNLIFERKLKYFEYIIEVVEGNKKMYHILIHKLEDSKKKSEIDEILKELKEKRKKFLVMSSPLYFNTKVFSEKIVDFVRIEKNIFNGISELKEVKGINKEEKEDIIEKLKDTLKKLNKKGEEILYEMRKQLSR